MKIDAQLDVDVLAYEHDDKLSVLLELAAPASATAERAASAIQVVLDRSGSMAGDRLEGAKQSLLTLVDRLDPRDWFGLVVFDDQAVVVIPTAPLVDKAAAKRAITSVQSGGSTDLAAGYLRGLQEARRATAASGTTLLLISDGHANAGEISPQILGGIAAKALESDRTTTSTLGYGLGYDERLLSALARAGAGNEHFAEDPDAAVALIAREVDGLLSQATQAMSLIVTMSAHVKSVEIHNDLPVNPVAEGIQVELGGMYAGETRRLVLTFDIPAIAALGLLEIATLHLSYVELPELRQVDVSLPLHVNVVPGDQAAGRVRDPEIHAELAYQKAQKTKREAASRLSEGDVAGAVNLLASASSMINSAVGCAPPGMADDLRQESDMLQALLAESRYGDSSRAAKLTSSDAALKSRRRGR